jgi:hypothetical protein
MFDVSIWEDKVNTCTACNECLYKDHTLRSGLFNAVGLFFGAVTDVSWDASSCTSSSPSTSVKSVPVDDGAMGEGSVTSLPGEMMALGEGGTRWPFWPVELL